MIHWTKLKKAVEDAGGTWTNRDDAEVFLANAGIDVVDEPAPAVTTPAPKQAAFDRGQPYGEIIGDIGIPGARFLQGGHYFNNRGEQVG